MKLSIISVILIGSFLSNSCNSQRDEQSRTQGEVSEVMTGASFDGASKIGKVRSDLNDAKETLAEEGNYVCCIEESCDYCALNEGSCPCYNELKAGRHVCIECYAGWQQGMGADPKIKKESVTTSFVGHEHGD